jgi:hypothetical protein
MNLFKRRIAMEPNRLHPLRAWAIAAVTALATLPASAQQAKTALESVPAEELKHIYLQCNAAAAEALLDSESAALCSRVNEELKHRVFGGDFERLLVWWRENKNIAAQAKAAP